MAEKNTADIGFEKEIWDAACVLRGNMDASEYKNVILGLIFLKYISDSFETRYQELVNEGDGFEEDRDEYTYANIFFVPTGARWKDIAAKAHEPEIGKRIAVFKGDWRPCEPDIGCIWKRVVNAAGIPDLCLLILRHQKHQIGSGTRQIYGILFDGAWLWEEYINLFIEDLFYHPMNKGGKGAQRLFSGNIGLIYPDFISRSCDNHIVADAKYKPINNIGNRDYLQMLAYMFRFDAKKGFFFYPEVEETENLQLWMNKGSTYEKNVEKRNDICVMKHGLKIPKHADHYMDFKEIMIAYENEFREDVKVHVLC